MNKLNVYTLELDAWIQIQIVLFYLFCNVGKVTTSLWLHFLSLKLSGEIIKRVSHYIWLTQV